MSTAWAHAATPRSLSWRLSSRWRQPQALRSFGESPSWRTRAGADDFGAFIGNRFLSLQLEETKGVLTQDFCRQPLRVFRAEITSGEFFFEHLADQLTRAFHRAVGFLDVPVVPADHHPRFVRQDFDGFVQRQLKV